MATANYLRRKLLKPVMRGENFEVYESDTLYCMVGVHAETGDRRTCWLRKAPVEDHHPV